jgi:hypothetical protein
MEAEGSQLITKARGTVGERDVFVSNFPRKLREIAGTHVIVDKLIDLRHEVFVAIYARKRASLNARVVRQVIDEMSGTFIDNSFHSQLPCGEVNLLDLRKIESCVAARHSEG